MERTCTDCFLPRTGEVVITGDIATFTSTSTYISFGTHLCLKQYSGTTQTDHNCIGTVQQFATPTVPPSTTTFSDNSNDSCTYSLMSLQANFQARQQWLLPTQTSLHLGRPSSPLLEKSQKKNNHKKSKRNHKKSNLQNNKKKKSNKSHKKSTIQKNKKKNKKTNKKSW